MVAHPADPRPPSEWYLALTLRWRDLAFGLGAVSAAWLVYGCLVESRRLVVERRKLRLPMWPGSMAGYRVAVLADLHIGHEYSVELAERAVAMAIDEQPQAVVLAGDVISRGFPDAAAHAEAVLRPLCALDTPVIAVFGNHEAECGARRLVAAYERLGIRLLRNQACRTPDGVVWAGVDSARLCVHDPAEAMRQARALDGPIVAVWHEPDMVECLPPGAALMLAGHSHGGQWVFPGGFTPMHTFMGSRFVAGFFDETPTPLYVSRGVGTTGPPARNNCPPEVSLLELHPL